ncbi:MAG: peptidoglycan-associated lipoprotein Pal [Asticcacaulis sp.]
MFVSKKTVVKLAVVSLAAISIAACSSKPKQEVVEPVPAPTPAPTTAPTPRPTPTPAPAPVGVVPGSQQDFVVNVGDRIYFDLDQSSVRADARAILDAQAAWLVRYPNVKIRIEGNADERGTREYNFALGARRAESVSQYLVSKGVLPSRISTISYGKENPIASGANEESWAQNRNAKTTLTEGAQ